MADLRPRSHNNKRAASIDGRVEHGVERERAARAARHHSSFKIKAPSLIFSSQKIGYFENCVLNILFICKYIVIFDMYANRSFMCSIPGNLIHLFFLLFLPKGIVHSLSSFTHPHVVPNLYKFLSSVEVKIYFEECW